MKEAIIEAFNYRHAGKEFNPEKINAVLHESLGIEIDKFGVSCLVAFGYRKADPGAKTRQSIDDIVGGITRRLATSYREFIADVTACFDISEVSGVSVRVSGYSTSTP